MEVLPSDSFGFSLLVFVLGMRHGLDPDHLATIDGLTRFNAAHHRRLACWCGVLFSLGHGAVVVAVAVTVSVLAQQWQAPQWLESFGAWTSIAVLAALGCLNAHAVWCAGRNQAVQLVGLRGRYWTQLSHTHRPVLVALVGALFALSFDTLSQAALFAFGTAHGGEWRQALSLGALFTLGMLVTDGVNGLWIARLVSRADQMALVVSRAMGVVVAGVSLSVAFFGVLRLTSPAVLTWAQGKELVLGACLVLVIGGCFMLIQRRAAFPSSVEAMRPCIGAAKDRPAGRR